MVVAIAGNISKEQAIAEVEQYFGTARAHTDGDEPQLTVPSFTRGVSVRQKDIEQVHICLAAPGLPAGHEDLYALVLLNNTLGNSTSSRLFQEVREDRGLAYSVFSFHTAYKDCGMFGIYTGTSPEHVSEVMSIIDRICQDVAEHGLTAEELRKGKEQVKGSMMLSLESTSSRMSRLGKNELVLGREVTLDETLQGIQNVTAADVQRVAQNILTQRFALAAVGPIDEDAIGKYQ